MALRSCAWSCHARADPRGARRRRGPAARGTGRPAVPVRLRRRRRCRLRARSARGGRPARAGPGRHRHPDATPSPRRRPTRGGRRARRSGRTWQSWCSASTCRPSMPRRCSTAATAAQSATCSRTESPTSPTSSRHCARWPPGGRPSTPRSYGTCCTVLVTRWPRCPRGNVRCWCCSPRATPTRRSPRSSHVTEAAIGKHVGNILAKLDLPPSQDTNRRVLAVITYLRNGAVRHRP